MIEIENNCALKWLKEQADYSADLIYCDPPYALGSEIIIKPNGKPDYKKAVDFMAKWEMPDGAFWEEFYIQANRVLKHGGHLLMFGIDRQLFLFGYYSNLAGFETKQSLYWYFISNFPKASDLSKMIDKNAGAEREIIKENPKKINNGKEFNVYSNEIRADFTAPSTELAKKYHGFKYSIAPLKQVVETIMVFQKPYKTGSCLHDVLAFENGDNQCTVGALDIENNRVEIKDNISVRKGKPQHKNKFSGNAYSDSKTENLEYWDNSAGRFPSQAFVTTETAEILDKQSGVSAPSERKHTEGKDYGKRDDNYKFTNKVYNTGGYNDTAGCSKILHKCDFETADFDLFVYEPKVSASERNAGCEFMEKKTMANLPMRSSEIESTEIANDGTKTHRTTSSGNNHPTLKPISLNYQITKLFKTPNPQTVLVPFSGAGSELIGLFKAGFENIKGCELNPEYVEIAKARVKHHCEDLFNQNILI